MPPTDIAGAAVAGTRPRILTLPLVLFLGAVAAIDVVALWQRNVLPGPAEAIVLLADGDLDGDERRRVLRALLDAGRRAEPTAQRWAALLAAVSLEDRESYDAQLIALGGPGVGMRVPTAGEQELLHLGDPLLGNILQALLAEAADDRVGARRRWQQVDTQCRLMVRPLAHDLAVAGLRRTG